MASNQEEQKSMVASDSPLLCTYIALMPLAYSLDLTNHNSVEWL